jgi:hypothetical protein
MGRINGGLPLECKTDLGNLPRIHGTPEQVYADDCGSGIGNFGTVGDFGNRFLTPASI